MLRSVPVGVGVAFVVGVALGVGVAFAVGVAFGVGVASGVGVTFGVAVATAVGVAAGVGVASDVGVAVDVGVTSGVGVASDVGVASVVRVASGVEVASDVGVASGVVVASGGKVTSGVGVGSAVGVTASFAPVGEGLLSPPSFPHAQADNITQRNNAVISSFFLMITILLCPGNSIILFSELSHMSPSLTRQKNVFLSQIAAPFRRFIVAKPTFSVNEYGDTDRAGVPSEIMSLSSCR